MIGGTTQEQRSGHLSGTQKLTCIGVHVDAGLAKPVRPRAFCEYAARTYGCVDKSDILGSNILRSGTDWNVNFDDGTGACNFDFKVVFENGTQRVENNINVCAISTFTIR